MPSSYLVLLISAAISTAWAQSIFINHVSEYSQLATCAEQPLSTIVRNMASGCGDDSKTTSYACFCSSSSSKFASIISREVIKTCSSNNEDASSALDVFSSYCQIGTTAIPTNFANSTSTSSSATPANTATTMVTSTTGATMPEATASSSSTALSTKSKIVIGVVIPVGIILLLGAITIAALIIRSHRRHTAALSPEAGENSPEPKPSPDDSSNDCWSDRSRSPTITTKFPFEMESPLAEKLEKALPVELPTDGRYGNGTTAHELQE